MHVPPVLFAKKGYGLPKAHKITATIVSLHYTDITNLGLTKSFLHMVKVRAIGQSQARIPYG